MMSSNKPINRLRRNPRKYFYLAFSLKKNPQSKLAWKKMTSYLGISSFSWISGHYYCQKPSTKAKPFDKTVVPEWRHESVAMVMGHAKLSEKQKTHWGFVYIIENRVISLQWAMYTQRDDHWLRWVHRSQTYLSIKNWCFLWDYPCVQVKFWLFSHTYWHRDSWKLHGWERSQVITHSHGSSEQFTEYSCSEWEARRKGNGMVTHSTIPVTMPARILHSETIINSIASLPHLLPSLNNPSRNPQNKFWFKFSKSTRWVAWWLSG